MIKCHVLAVAAGATEASGAQDAGHGGQRRDVLLVVPLVELGLELRRDVHGVQQEPAGIAWRKLVAGQDLIAFEAHQTLDLRGHALRPRRRVFATDRQVRRALQHRDAVEIVGGDRDLAVLHPDPALADEEPRHALPFRQVLGVVPVVELVLGGPRHAHRRDQRALGHDGALPLVVEQRSKRRDIVAPAGRRLAAGATMEGNSVSLGRPSIVMKRGHPWGWWNGIFNTGSSTRSPASSSSSFWVASATSRTRRSVSSRSAPAARVRWRLAASPCTVRRASSPQCCAAACITSCPVSTRCTSTRWSPFLKARSATCSRATARRCRRRRPWPPTRWPATFRTPRASSGRAASAGRSARSSARAPTPSIWRSSS